MIYLILVFLIILFVILLVRAIKFKPLNKELTKNSNENLSQCSGDSAVYKLSEAIKIKTVSYNDYSKTNWNEFVKYREKLKELFPLVHSNMKNEVINSYSLLFHWEGKDKTKLPILITAHMDVVPVESGTLKDWSYDPFSGDIKDGYVWGRGALDTKIHMITALEASELLLKENYIPERDIYFAFGHDEEVGGTQGAACIVEHLKEKGISFEYLIDEGGCVTTGTISNINKPLALIGIGEKGYSNIKISISGDGGHSSMPPIHSALGILAKAIMNLENKQCKAKLTEPIKEFLMKIGPEMNFINRLILSNLWLFKPLFIKIFTKSKSGNAMLRTTTAVTMAEASEVPNVLPQSASTTINFRILPGEKGSDLIDHIKRVNKDLDIALDILRLEEPSMVSDSKACGFLNIKEITEALYDNVIVAPYIVLAGTDARKYEPICKNIYRFTPYLIDNSELGKIHGTNENISIDNIKKCTQFFYSFIKKC